MGTRLAHAAPEGTTGAKAWQPGSRLENAQKAQGMQRNELNAVLTCIARVGGNLPVSPSSGRD